MIIDFDKCDNWKNNPEKFKAIVQEFFDINTQPYQLLATQVLKENDIWLVAAPANSSINIVKYVQQLDSLENIFNNNSHKVKIKLVACKP